MDTKSAVIWAKVNAGRPMMVFDWIKAASLIRDRNLIGNLRVAGAGLQGDWEWTGGAIFKEGRIVPQEETYTFLASFWAPPELNLDGDNFECWVYQKQYPNWGSDTYWPEEALATLLHQSPDSTRTYD